eukprot:Transcript_26617.p2 GENE.Transcript_26617~~Transcript_26617.p2  ORF type:complete len:223 (+),score=68.41 Transcript_26617:378-1046(+)
MPGTVTFCFCLARMKVHETVASLTVAALAKPRRDAPAASRSMASQEQSSLLGFPVLCVDTTTQSTGKPRRLLCSWEAMLRLAAGASRRGLASAATVSDATVSCTFILAKQKQKVTVPGMVGWTLLKTAQHHNLPVNGCTADTPWDYLTFGEGPSSVEDHVIVSQEYFEQTLPMGYQEKDLLEMTERFPTPTSRLAACITLTKEMDGITVIVPDTNQDLTNYV